MRTLEQLWPPFALRVAVGPLTLRAVRDDDLPALVALAEQGIHDPAARPFLTPWSTAPPEMLGPGTSAYHWQARAGMRPECWSLELVARWHGEVVGVQSVHTRDERGAAPHAGGARPAGRAGRRRGHPCAAGVPGARLGGLTHPPGGLLDRRPPEGPLSAAAVPPAGRRTR